MFALSKFRLSGKQLFWVGVSVVLAVYIGLATGDALTTSPWCDEAWFADPVHTWMQKGFPGTEVLTPFGWGPPMFLADIQHRTYWIMPLDLIAQFGWYKVFGLSLISMRELSIFWGACVLLALGVIVDRLTASRWTALIAVAFAGTDYFFLTRASDGRMDIMSAAFSFGALAAYLVLRETHLFAAVGVAGTLAAMSLLTHPIGGFLAVTALVTVGIYFDRARIRWRHIFLMALPYLVGIALWSIYISQNPAGFRSQLGSNSAGRMSALLHPLASLKQEWTSKYLPVFGFSSADGLSLQSFRSVVLVAYFLALFLVLCIPALRKRYRPLWLLTLTQILALSFFDGAKRFYYLIHIVPLLSVMFALCLVWFWQHKLRYQKAVVAVAAIVLIIQVGGTSYRIQRNEYANNFQPAVEAIKQHGGAGVSVIGSAELGFELNFPDTLTDDVSLGFYTGERPKLIFIPERFYALWFHDMESSLPPAVRHIRTLLSNDYHKIYDRGGYQVYRRRY